MSNRAKRKLKKKIEEITNDVVFIEVDDNIIHYCSLPKHPGSIGLERLKTKRCKEKQCEYYKEFKLKRKYFRTIGFFEERVDWIFNK